ncbi:MAG: 3'-5' exonuclease [Cellvibrio sp.]|jgi:DNA polymerase-3 subunit epsilon
MHNANTVIVLDFETTGLSPEMGDRAIEIGAVRIQDGVITERFQRLMNPGRPVSSFIEQYTGISNEMLQDAPPAAEVMQEFAAFVEDYNLVAHNASFDQRFLRAELKRLRLSCNNPFSCSMLASRRIYQTAPNHTLSGLVDFKKIPNDGVFHRALADAEMTARLWLAILEDIAEIYKVSACSFNVMQQLTTIPKRSVQSFFQKISFKSV